MLIHKRISHLGGADDVPHSHPLRWHIPEKSTYTHINISYLGGTDDVPHLHPLRWHILEKSTYTHINISYLGGADGVPHSCSLRWLKFYLKSFEQLILPAFGRILVLVAVLFVIEI